MLCCIAHDAKNPAFIRKQDNLRAIKILTSKDLDKLECPPMGHRFINH